MTEHPARERLSEEDITRMLEGLARVSDFDLFGGTKQQWQAVLVELRERRAAVKFCAHCGDEICRRCKEEGDCGLDEY